MSNDLRVLVTGGQGFLGASVVAGLAGAPGIGSVVSADLRLPAEPTPGVEHVIGDVTDPAAVDALMEGVDTVVHLASIVNPGKGMSDDLAYTVDVDGTRHVLEACVRHGVRRIVVSSSGAAYGYHADNPEWLSESDPVRGNDEFAYSKHKRLVEEMLAEYRTDQPQLEQVVLRIGTILGANVNNQITYLFRKKRLLKIAGSSSPFVFIWDEDLVAIVLKAVTGDVTGIFNVAGTGALTIDDIATVLGKGTLAIPEVVLRSALRVLKPLGLSQYGPEQTKFLQFRPVLDNARLQTEFGYIPDKSSLDALKNWRDLNDL